MLRSKGRSFSDRWKITIMGAREIREDSSDATGT